MSSLYELRLIHDSRIIHLFYGFQFTTNELLMLFFTDIQSIVDELSAIDSRYQSVYPTKDIFDTEQIFVFMSLFRLKREGSFRPNFRLTKNSQ
jgi:hypothetical protein